MAGALKGIKILDLTSVGFGPYACQILGDYGAEIIKIESPDGDITRGIGPFRNNGMGHFFLNAKNFKLIKDTGNETSNVKSHEI